MPAARYHFGIGLVPAVALRDELSATRLRAKQPEVSGGPTPKLSRRVPTLWGSREAAVTDTVASTLLLGQRHLTASFEQQTKILTGSDSEAKIARMQSQIKNLKRLRDRERKIIASLRQAIAPIRYCARYSDDGERLDVPAFADRVALPRLRTLALNMSNLYNGEQLIPVLQRFELPALEALTLISDDDDDFT
ncbi:hypothetical protein B0H10DRAFT_2431528 [Mycena sp. CBHHK59/15]|nr:hypothetical protein B0H10DRAFT_2431528 [Mycena sp. CBHHK59/15]